MARLATKLREFLTMIFRNKLPLMLLIVAVAATRWAFRSNYLYDLDSMNFALAMQRFDPRVHQPHPPGYFLYIYLGRLLNVVFHDANLALVVLSVLASCGAVIVIYAMALEWFGAPSARFAGVLFLFSPLAWFHGTVALTYIVEAFCSALTGYFCWRIVRGEKRFVIPAGIVLGLSAGIRPSSLLFLTPLFLFSLRKPTPMGRLVGVAALLATLTAWFVPMVVAAGGIRVYFEALASLWGMVPAKETVFNSSPANSIARAFTIIFIYLLSFGAASFAPLVANRKNTVDRAKRNFTLVWVLPALCFFTFGYLKFVNSGYLLLLFAPAALWLGLWASEWYERAGWTKPLKLTVLGVGLVLNVFVFVASPLYCSYRQVRRFEADLERIKSAIPKIASPNDTVILGVDSHFSGFRHAGYYLPDYLTVEYPEVKLKEGPRVFLMHQRDTKLLGAVPVSSYRRFVFFPLPEGKSYRDYLQTVTDKLPSQSIKLVSVEGRDYVTGPISDLPLLFPHVIQASEEGVEGVYAPFHSGTGPVNNRSQ
jgi:hypothetical protein